MPFDDNISYTFRAIHNNSSIMNPNNGVERVVYKKIIIFQAYMNSPLIYFLKAFSVQASNKYYLKEANTIENNINHFL